MSKRRTQQEAEAALNNIAMAGQMLRHAAREIAERFVPAADVPCVHAPGEDVSPEELEAARAEAVEVVREALDCLFRERAEAVRRRYREDLRRALVGVGHAHGVRLDGEDPER